ncbi:hypothetical protein [uncultured Muribaculum sp.]|uniref:hypothetical protein n=1 Tax=uncultured Muribaculum sp. TaxID=1918613 RepID=UPI0025E84AB2|nr:hypothetical protein [uncultured Muribaculum sp.]
MWIIDKARRIKTQLQIEHYLDLPTSKISSERQKSLCSLLRDAQKNVPFYRQLLANQCITYKNCFNILQSLPIISKCDLQNNPSMIANYVRDNWKYWLNTGGSTGVPLRFPIGGRSKFELNRELFCQADLYVKMAGTYKIRIAAVDGSRVDEPRINHNEYWIDKGENFPYGKFHYSTLHLNDKTFYYYLQHLNYTQPDVIRGYPSGIYELAQYIQHYSEQLNFIPKGIYLTSENILKYQIDTIEAVFKCPVWGQYGHSESSVFAIRYPHSDQYICNPLYGVVEIIKEDGTHAKIGEVGEIVVTGFSNKALPFIRYRTGDLAEYGGESRDGVLINQLMGRSVEYIFDNAGKKRFLVGLIFGGHLKVFNDMSAWQLQQDKVGEIIVRVVKGLTYSDESETELINFFESNNIKPKIHYIDNIIKTKRGKQIFLIQNIK